jgi:hypothetical protein
MSARKTTSVLISLPLQLDRVREREHRTRSEILSDALRRYISVAARDRTIPVEDALPEEIEGDAPRRVRARSRRIRASRRPPT